MNLDALQLALEQNLGNRLTPELAVGIIHAASQVRLSRIDVDQFDAQEYCGYSLQCERIEDVIEDVKPLHCRHWEETEGYRHGVALDPDYDYMVNAERTGRFMLFTVRTNGQLVGNCMMYLTQSTHTRKWIAEEDTIFIDKEHRKGRIGIKLIQYVERVLATLGVTEIRVTVKTVNRVGDLLQALGYQHTANQLIKVLGEAHVQ
jgi:GNAT superfamily N-acetyltransferase